MKRIGNLFDLVTAFAHLLQAFKKARSGTRKTDTVCRFGFFAEPELLKLQAELCAGTYTPRPYRYFTVRDPKRRTIAVADFRDRVVHHAVVGVLEPIFEKIFIPRSYATRKEKGAHKAVFYAQECLRRNEWFFKTDIAHYFDSVNHATLMAQIRQKIKDPALLQLIETIVTNAGRENKGLPIGNLTSQFFANVYLNGFDHWVKNTLGAKFYVRYMDDFVLFSNDKAQLKAWKTEIEDFLFRELGLHLKPSATFFNRRINGLSFLGTRIYPSVIRMHPEHSRRAARKLLLKTRDWQNGLLTDEAYAQTLNSYQSYFSVYGAHALRKQIWERLGLI